MNIGFEQARARTQARLTATILDLEREMPAIRACALQQWKGAGVALQLQPGDRRATAAEAATFWDWGLVELLVRSGLRIEEASELTTLDILKRQLADGRVYYLLHIKPSKFDRARVIPIGDGLGRVIAEIIRHVKRFYGMEAVPSCDHWDHHERLPRPRVNGGRPRGKSPPHNWKSRGSATRCAGLKTCRPMSPRRSKRKPAAARMCLW